MRAKYSHTKVNPDLFPDPDRFHITRRVQITFDCIPCTSEYFSLPFIMLNIYLLRVAWPIPADTGVHPLHVTNHFHIHVYTCGHVSVDRVDLICLWLWMIGGNQNALRKPTEGEHASARSLKLCVVIVLSCYNFYNTACCIPDKSTKPLRLFILANCLSSSANLDKGKFRECRTVSQLMDCVNFITLGQIVASPLRYVRGLLLLSSLQTMCIKLNTYNNSRIMLTFGFRP